MTEKKATYRTKKNTKPDDVKAEAIPPPPSVNQSAHTDAPEDHRVILSGLDVAISHDIRVVFMIDQTGGKDVNALKDLEDHLKRMGYFLHCIVVTPPAQPAAPRPNQEN